MKQADLGYYLNNHIAGSVAGIELVKQMVNENRGSELAHFLEKLKVELEEDQEMVRRMLKAIDQKESYTKELGAWLLEKLAVAPIAGITQSPYLRRVVELEAILLGSQGRIAMWTMLEKLFQADPRLTFADFTALRERAQRQARELDSFREAAAAAAFQG